MSFDFTAQFFIFSVVTLLALKLLWGVAIGKTTNILHKLIPKNWSAKTKMNIAFYSFIIGTFIFTKDMIWPLIGIIIFIIARRKKLWQSRISVPRN